MKEMPAYKSPVSLIPGGCLQYLDFALDLARVEKRVRHFREERRPDGDDTGRHRNVLFCLAQDEDGCFIDMISGKSCDYDYEIKARKCLDVWLDRWLPIPVLRTRDQKWPDGGCRHEQGPGNWARCRLSRDTEDPGRLRLVVVFDVGVEAPPETGEPYHALSPGDVEAHATFRLAWHVRDNSWFCNSPWVDEWIYDVWFRHMEKTRKKGYESEYFLEYLASYLTLLEVLREAMGDLAVQVINPKRDNPVDVDFILDIGNSRTSGILVETLPQRITNLNDSYLLQLRDLSEPQHVYTDPFETRVEFTEAGFGNEVLSRRSGRRTPAFAWPSPVRVGPEACRLSTHAVCAEGTTGMSSPKRYLWDERPWQQSWRYNTGGGPEPLVTRGLLPRRVNREGTPLFCAEDPPDPLFRRNPILRTQNMEVAFESLFTRSSLMMFMLVEILTHALMTINSPAQRARRDLPNVPRRLRSVIFTVPSGMPVAEQRIYRRWVSWAVRLLWEAMGWQDFFIDERQKRPPARADYRLSPRVRCDWDEATCTQLVYLYNELTRKFHGDAHHLFGLAGQVRAEAGDRPSLRIATIDMGGGTTDLSVTTFVLDSDTGSSTRIRPQIEFRDGFSIAGDDIVRDVVIQHVLPAIGEAAASHAGRDGRAVLAQLFGREGMDKSQQDRNHRALFVRQVAAPLALSLLSVYERADLLAGTGRLTRPLRDFFRPPPDTALPAPDAPLPEAEGTDDAPFPRHPWPSQAVVDYVEKGLERLAPGCGFSLMDVPVTIDPRQIDRTIRDAVSRPLANLCEVIQVYDCDMLLLTGRPSIWPAIIATIHAKLPTPPSRIVPMCRYRVGPWYPFADAFGHIADPKTTVVVGAILCALAEGHLEGFSFDTASLVLTSTARFIGEMEMQTGQLKKDKVWFNVDMDDARELELAREVIFGGPITVGFRQLDVERWTTTRFYMIDFASEDARRKASGKLPYTLSMRYRLAELDEDGDVQRDEGELEILEISDRTGSGVNRRDLEVRLQTLPLDEGYWLDTGIVYHAV